MCLSGGRSSAYSLISLINGGFGKLDNHIVSFQNTGKEHQTCYDFLKNLEGNLPIKITYLEYCVSELFISEFINPSFSYGKFDNAEYKSIGEILDVEKLKAFDYSKSPKNDWYKNGYAGKRFKIVKFEELNKVGKPFCDAFLYTCAIRIMKGKGLILPNQSSRWCTGEMKDKVLNKYLKSIGIKKYIKYLGIRNDEPLRVDRVLRKTDKNVTYDMPLNWMGVSKMDVLKTWRNQSIDLGKDDGSNLFNDFLGNCTHCHLKSKVKKKYLMKIGISHLFYAQIERLVNEYNRDSDAMNRSHGTYDKLKEESLNEEISLQDVLSDEEIELSCTRCTD